MKVESKHSATETGIINLVLSLSSGITVFQFVNDIFKRTAKKGGIFTKTGSFVISSILCLETVNKVYAKLKEVMIWQKLMSLA